MFYYKSIAHPPILQIGKVRWGEVISFLRFLPVIEGTPTPKTLDYRLSILSINTTHLILFVQTWETYNVIAGYQHWIGFWSFEFQILKSLRAMCIVQKCWLSSVQMQVKYEWAAWPPHYQMLCNPDVDIRNWKEKASGVGSDVSFFVFPLKYPWCHRNRSEISTRCKTRRPAESRVIYRILILHFTKNKARERGGKYVDPFSLSVPKN